MSDDVHFEVEDFTKSGLEKIKGAIAAELGIILDGYEIWDLPSPVMIGTNPQIPEGYIVDGERLGGVRSESGTE